MGDDLGAADRLDRGKRADMVDILVRDNDLFHIVDRESVGGHCCGDRLYVVGHGCIDERKPPDLIGDKRQVEHHRTEDALEGHRDDMEVVVYSHETKFTSRT